MRLGKFVINDIDRDDPDIDLFYHKVYVAKDREKAFCIIGFDPDTETVEVIDFDKNIFTIKWMEIKPRDD